MHGRQTKAHAPNRVQFFGHHPGDGVDELRKEKQRDQHSPAFDEEVGQRQSAQIGAILQRGQQGAESRAHIRTQNQGGGLRISQMPTRGQRDDHSHHRAARLYGSGEDHAHEHAHRLLQQILAGVAADHLLNPGQVQHRHQSLPDEKHPPEGQADGHDSFQDIAVGAAFHEQQSHTGDAHQHRTQQQIVDADDPGFEGGPQGGAEHQVIALLQGDERGADHAHGGDDGDAAGLHHRGGAGARQQTLQWMAQRPPKDAAQTAGKGALQDSRERAQRKEKETPASQGFQNMPGGHHWIPTRPGVRRRGLTTTSGGNSPRGITSKPSS